ncbi:DUF3857 domain-containing transglutaminase family protein [Pedobacter xixiisoli]|uniref:Transglutaminase-like superfamily protein n=1 Tax=Pedobacter xixiisoli TaxID=1476464 RepID=A0A285ZTZ4_9SPHI|nr:DUF3857 domain-containing transglutaminase family protein [Pedobacter xixiisoli]SOD13106.1 Transglutaminase-like superfamily protein [Pedobacter xixiisoli]
MKNFSLLFALLGFTFLTKAQNYAVDQIPASLKNRAHAVVRDSKTVVDMRSADNVLLSINKAITVLNKNGERQAQLALFYDKNISIKSAKGEIYDEFGKQMGKFSLSNFKDESAVNDFSLFEDSRVKYYIPQVNSYPYTIVYTYEIRNKQNLIIPDWRPIAGFDIAVEKSSYQFIYSTADEIRVFAQNYKGKAEEVNSEKQKSIIWKVEGVNALKHEPYSPNPDTYFMSIKVAPKNFSYYNFKGNYTDWEGLGKLSYDYLLKDRRVLPVETIQFVKDLVKEETTDKAKAKKIYEYFQKKIRYISVQIGIGGFQPIKAAEVDRLGYGDCKALVNYMQALLEAVGIESYYCVVQAGEQKTDLLPSFASMEQGNHIILCLPLNGDITWLECTSQDAPFGYLGSFTDDRWVLACTKDGGKLMKTPKFEALNSQQVRTADLSLSKDGKVTGSLLTKFDGSQFDNHYFLTKKSPAEKQKQLKYLYDINNIEFTSIDLVADNDVPRFTEKLSVTIDSYATAGNDRISFTPNVFNLKRSVPSVRNRTLPLELKRGYTDIDSISFKLDENIIPVFLPKIMEVTSKFGTYFAEIKMKDGKLFYYRKLVMKDGIFEPSDYEGFENFVNEVASNDRIRITLAMKVIKK